MGLMQFLLPQREGLEQLALHGAYLVGSDGSPWETRVEWTGDRLVVSRNTRESGYLIMPWPIGTFGPLALSTATLLPRERPYHLALELCRGTLSRLLGQLDATALQDPHIREPLQASEAHFIQASLRQTDTQACAEEAEQSLLAALDCMQRRVRQVVTERNANASFSSRLFGLEAHGVEEFKQLRGLRRWPGNALLFYQTWRDTELSPGEFDWGPWIEGLKMALSSRRRIVAGPILDLHRDALPDWLYLWDGDFDTLQTYVAQYVRCIVQKLQRQIHVWYATASTNVGKVLHLGEEQKLRLTIAALEALRSVDRQTPTLVGIQQPWGEYLGRETLDLSPVQFADIVIRADLGVSGFVLELDMAVGAGYTIPRDLLEFQRLLDQWSGFNAPLVLRISLPTEANDQQATRLDYLRDILQIAASKSAVQGILWSRLRDDEHLSSGLFQPNGQPKSVLQMLTELDQHARQT